MSLDKFIIVKKSDVDEKNKKRKNDEEAQSPEKKLKTDEGALHLAEVIPIEFPADCPMAQTLKDEQWKKLLAVEFAKPYYKKIESAVATKRKEGEVYPPVHEVYNAFNCCPLDKLRIVIIGQDPYFNPGQAEGLCFSVKKGVAIPPSLNRIYKVIAENIPGFKIPKHGSLMEWAQRGVLMLNATLTVDKGNANSHAKFGWQEFTTEIMNILNKEKKGLIYLLWGNFAQKKGKVIDKTKHHILEAAHPSPMGGSAWNSCKHFSQVNEILKKEGKDVMDWTISG
jgi:uracil-DNA glycosylase